MSLRASSSPSTTLRFGAKSSWVPEEKKAAGNCRLITVLVVRASAAFRVKEDSISCVALIDDDNGKERNLPVGGEASSRTATVGRHGGAIGEFSVVRSGRVVRNLLFPSENG